MQRHGRLTHAVSAGGHQLIHEGGREQFVLSFEELPC
jgi:hypothetical protein